MHFFSRNPSRGWRRRKRARIIHIFGCICRFTLEICKNVKKRTETLYQSFSPFMAEKEGFEPSRQLSHPTPLAGEPLRPLGYFSMPDGLAEREGFEPPVPFDITGFQDQRLKPLGHLSPDENRIDYYSGKSSLCQCLLRKNCGNFAGLQYKLLQGKGAALTDAPGRAALRRKTGKQFFVSQCNAGKI